MVALLATIANAETVVIELNNGKTIEGELVAENDQAVTLLRSGIREPYPRSDIKEIRRQRELTIPEQFAQRKANLDSDDLVERYKLAAWAYEEKAYRLALDEVRAIRDDITAETPEQLITALDKFETVINNRLQLEQPEAPAVGDQPQPDQSQPDQPDASRDNADDQSAPAKPLELLTDEQVNLIRVYEVDLAADPQVTVPRDVFNKLLENYRQEQAMEPFLASDGRRRLRTLSDSDFLRLLFDLRARNLYREITIRTDPPVMQDFRRIVYPNYVANYFRRYFSSGERPVLPLIFKRGNDTNEVYTNFYILAHASHEGNALIDRDRPEESLLLQWGLPRESARYPAPELKGWRPFFTGVDDRNFENYVDVLGNLYKPKPSYGIQYAMPTVRVPEPETDAQAQAEN